MYAPLQKGWRYLKYWIQSSNKNGHGVHSPFVYELIERVFTDDRTFYVFPLIEAVREECLFNANSINAIHFDTDATKQNSYATTISKIANAELKSPKFGQLLFRLVNHFNAYSILELGTSLGITTSYLATANPHAKVVTLEGAPDIALKAKQHFQYIGLHNIEQVVGHFDHTLTSVLQEMKSLDFVFVDGNHRLEPTLRYFNQMKPYLHEHSILFIDGIHLSKDMEQVWLKIQKDDQVTLTIDLFFIGLVFFRKEQKKKQHFIVQF